MLMLMMMMMMMIATSSAASPRGPQGAPHFMLERLGVSVFVGEALGGQGGPGGNILVGLYRQPEVIWGRAGGRRNN